jgi:hypothetical protein
MRKKALRPEERAIQVINWFAIRIQHDNTDVASLSQIAKGLGLTPSSHLRRICERMVTEGSLTASVLNRSGRWQGRGYMLTEGTFQRPIKRQIKLNFTVDGIKQMELL